MYDVWWLNTALCKKKKPNFFHTFIFFWWFVSIIFTLVKNKGIMWPSHWLGASSYLQDLWFNPNLGLLSVQSFACSPHVHTGSPVSPTPPTCAKLLLGVNKCLEVPMVSCDALPSFFTSSVPKKPDQFTVLTEDVRTNEWIKRNL